MTIPRNLSFLAEGASSTGVLGTANGGTGLNTVGTNGQVLTSNGTSLSFATPATTNPAGSTGQVQYNNGGAFGAITSGTSGQVLTSAGSAAAPTWTTPAAGAMTLISTQTASNSAALTFTGLSGYRAYYLLFTNLTPITTTNMLLVYLGYGSTPTYITSGYHITSTFSSLSTGATQYALSSGSITLSNGNQQTGALNAFNGFLTINNVNSSTYPSAQYISSYGGGGAYYTETGSGIIASNAGPTTAITIYYTSGNISSGSVTLYGLS
jgi:hypothetical protein